MCFAPMGFGKSRDRKILTEDTARKMWGVATKYLMSCQGNLLFPKLCHRIILLSLAVKAFNAKLGSSLSFYIQLLETGNSKNASLPFRWDEILGLVVLN